MWYYGPEGKKKNGNADSDLGIVQLCCEREMTLITPNIITGKREVWSD